MARQEHLEILEAVKTTSSYFLFPSVLQEYLEKDGVFFVLCGMKCNELNLSCCNKQLQRCSLTFFTERSRSNCIRKRGHSLPAPSFLFSAVTTESMGLCLLLWG